ncbi:MAG: HD-GYP domain-containing protein [Roseburia sp.]|nr:HD-GYP domain-containing protein [Roseburia sp.]
MGNNDSLSLALIFVLSCTVFCFLYIRSKMKELERKQGVYKSIVNQSLETFAHAIDAKDEDTNGHSVRVAAYSREIAKRMGFNEEKQEQIYYMGMLHDIGKIGIPDSILKKPGKLTEEEMEIIRSHPSIGGEILKDFTAIEGISDGARYHHERYDGNGYNEGLKGEQIPLFARIICVADCYDTMSSKRVYKNNHDKEYILKELRECSGKQFDPKIIPYMIEMIEDGTVS